MAHGIFMGFLWDLIEFYRISMFFGNFLRDFYGMVEGWFLRDFTEFHGIFMGLYGFFLWFFMGSLLDFMELYTISSFFWEFIGFLCVFFCGMFKGFCGTLWDYCGTLYQKYNGIGMTIYFRGFLMGFRGSFNGI